MVARVGCLKRGFCRVLLPPAPEPDRVTPNSYPASMLAANSQQLSGVRAVVSSKISRLLALTDAQFTQTRRAPKRKNFKRLNVNAGRLGPKWGRERTAAARMMAIVVGDDSEALL